MLGIAQPRDGLTIVNIFALQAQANISPISDASIMSDLYFPPS